MGTNDCRADLENIILKSVHRSAERHVGGGWHFDLLLDYCINIVIRGFGQFIYRFSIVVISVQLDEIYLL